MSLIMIYLKEQILRLFRDHQGPETNVLISNGMYNASIKRGDNIEHQFRG